MHIISPFSTSADRCSTLDNDLPKVSRGEKPGPDVKKFFFFGGGGTSVEKMKKTVQVKESAFFNTLEGRYLQVFEVHTDSVS